MQSIGLKSAAAGVLAAAAAGALAQAQEWLPLGTVHDRVYAMNKPSLTPIDGGFMFGVFTDKNEGAEPDPLPNGKSYRSSFLTVEVHCAEQTFRIARARFFAGGKASGEVVAEDNAPAGQGWTPGQPDTIGAAFVAVACPQK
jgi:hypothetical protein